MVHVCLLNLFAKTFEFTTNPGFSPDQSLYAQLQHLCEHFTRRKMQKGDFPILTEERFLPRSLKFSDYLAIRGISGVDDEPLEIWRRLVNLDNLKRDYTPSRNDLFLHDELVRVGGVVLRLPMGSHGRRQGVANVWRGSSGKSITSLCAHNQHCPNH